MDIGLAFIGAGWVVRTVYLPFFSHHPNIRRIVAYDVDPVAVEVLQRINPQLERADSLDHVLDDPDIELLIVASPNDAHCGQVLRALDRGKIVLCEKPLCTRLEDVAVLERAATQHSGALYASAPNRFRRDVALLREKVEMGAVGQPYRIAARWLRSRGVPARAWYRDRLRSGGGVLIDLGPHLIDVALFVCGFPHLCEATGSLASYFQHDPARLASWQGPTYREQGASVEDNAAVFLRSSEPPLSVSVELSWAAHVPSDITCIEVFGSEGYMRLKSVFGFSHDTLLERGEVVVRTASSERVHSFDLSDRSEPYSTMLDSYMKEITSGCPSSDPREALRVMHIIHSIYDKSKPA